MDERKKKKKNFYDNQKKDISNERELYGLSLRKKTLENNFLKKRLNNLEPKDNLLKYKINVNSLNIKNEYKSLSFSTLKETLDKCSKILSIEQDKDNIYFIIFFLNKIQFKSNEISLIQSNIPNQLCLLLQKYIEDIILVNEILTIIINITYYCKKEVTLLFSEIPFLNIYNQILNKYNNEDKIIFSDLILIFGNLVCGDHQIQKLFYETKMIDILTKIYESTSNGDKKRENLIWFFTCFMNNIRTNDYFKNKIDFFIWGIDFFFDNLLYEQSTFYCLLGMAYLCSIEDTKITNYFLTKENFFKYILTLPDKYFELVCRILCDISSINDEINLNLIRKYNITQFILKGLNSQSSNFQTLTLYLLNNYINDENNEIKQIFLDCGIINKLLELNKSSFVNSVLYATLLCISSLLLNSNKQIIFILYQKKIISKIIEVISQNSDPIIIKLALDSIISILKKDNTDEIYKKQFVNYGISELLNKIYLEKKNKIIEKIIGQLLQEYFSSPLN